MPPLYTDYSAFLSRHFMGKVQKLPVDAGFTCPNRDGTLSHSGCVFCNNVSFTPRYCGGLRGVRQQIEAGKRFFARKYPQMSYLAYFQAHTNTYAPLDRLEQVYREALDVPGVEGLVVATRPDCVPDVLLDALPRWAGGRFVMLELGVESTDDAALRRMNRGHSFACAADAVRRAAARGIHVGVHLILGLPGEPQELVPVHAARLSALPVEVVKLHQLQVVRGTELARRYAARPDAVRLFSPESYAQAVADFLERLRPDIALDRFVSQTPPPWLIAPRWGLRGQEFQAVLRRVMKERRTWQGRLYAPGEMRIMTETT